MAKELNWNGTEVGAKASNVTYDNSGSGMEAKNVQQAIDELKRTGGGGGGGSYAPYNGMRFAYIGDSFSAPGAWQAEMKQRLHISDNKNKAVSGGSWSGADSKSAYAQAQALVADAFNPDYIVIVLGTNDVANNVALGDVVIPSSVSDVATDLDLTTLTGGMQACLHTLKAAFTDAIIKVGYTPAGYIHDNFSTRAASNALCERLKEVALVYGVGYIETRACGICPWLDNDLHTYTGKIDGGVWSGTGHPSADGQKRIGEYMARIMLSNL